MTAAFTTEASVQDFCVADPSLPDGPAGYSCKDPKKVKASDFSFSLAQKSNTSNPFRAGVSPAIPPAFPGLNGQGVSIARVDIEVGGVVPFHTHPRASEIVLVVQGVVQAGFVSTDNKAYLKKLHEGEAMVFPQGLMHFQINVGQIPAIIFASFGSDKPGLQIADFTFFGNDLMTDVVVKTTFISRHEVRRLKGVFGGSN